jgi:nucleotide-binding universal stress UspA family protein
VRFVHVVNELIIANDFLAINYGELVDRLRDDGQKILDAAAARARAKGVASESDLIETIGGQAAREILNVSRKWGADLIVMGTHGRRGIRRLALGSDAEVVLRNSGVPVLLVRDAQEEH